jgi:hypothetical protein
MLAIGIVAVVGAVHMTDDTPVTAGGGGGDPCTSYIGLDKTNEGSYTTQPEPDCPPPDCEHGIGYRGDDGTDHTWKPDYCHATTTMHDTTRPPTTPCVSAWVDEHGNAHAYDNCGTSPSTIKTTTTARPTAGLFSVNVFAFCGPDFLPEISITFGNRPDLNGQQGVLSFSTGGSVFLVFQSNQTVTIPYPNTTQNVNLIYSLGTETATASVTYPPDCPPGTTTTTTTGGGGTTTTTRATTTTTTTGGGGTTTTRVTTTTSGSSTTSTSTTVRPGTPPITGPADVPFTFGAAATVCVREVPTIRIVFQNTFPELAGRTGTLTMADLNGNVVSTQPLVYQPNTTVDLLYPGTRVNADGSIADVPGWNLNSAGFWVRDPSDEFLREGIVLTYTVNPTATATVTYPPESSTCANPDGPFPPTATAPPGGLPPTK